MSLFCPLQIDKTFSLGDNESSTMHWNLSTFDGIRRVSTVPGLLSIWQTLHYYHYHVWQAAKLWCGENGQAKGRAGLLWPCALSPFHRDPCQIREDLWQDCIETAWKGVLNLSAVLWVTDEYGNSRSAHSADVIRIENIRFRPRSEVVISSK